MQFGYVTMFTTAWPLATACAVINNFFELRGDAFRLLFDNRRPRPRAVKGIGEWLEMLWLVCKLSVAVSAGLIAVGTGQAEFWAEQWCENQAERLQRNAALGEESVEGVVAEEMLGIMGPDMKCVLRVLRCGAAALPGADATNAGAVCRRVRCAQLLLLVGRAVVHLPRAGAHRPRHHLRRADQRAPTASSLPWNCRC